MSAKIPPPGNHRDRARRCAPDSPSLGAGDVCTATKRSKASSSSRWSSMTNCCSRSRTQVPMFKPPLFIGLRRDRSPRRNPQSDGREPPIASALYAIAGALLTMVFAYGILASTLRSRRTRARRILPVHQPGPFRPRGHGAVLLRVPLSVRFSSVAAQRLHDVRQSARYESSLPRST